MGGRLMLDGLHYGGRAKLSSGGLLLLVCMCAHARDVPSDTTEAGVWFGGWRVACITLGWPEDHAGQVRYDRARAELVRAGLIADDGLQGRQRRYVLTFRRTT